MFGWQPGEGTIVERFEYMVGDGLLLHDYVVEVYPDDGSEPFRAEMGDPRVIANFTPPSEGDTVRVTANRTRQRARFHHGDPATSLRDVEHRRHEARRAAIEAALAEPVRDRS